MFHNSFLLYLVFFFQHCISFYCLIPHKLFINISTSNETLYLSVKSSHLKQYKEIIVILYEKLLNRLWYNQVINPAYDPDDGSIEESAKEQNGEHVGFSELKDVTVRIMLWKVW